MKAHRRVIDRHCTHCGKPVIYEPTSHSWIHAGDSTFLADPRCRKNTRQSTVAEPLRQPA